MQLVVAILIIYIILMFVGAIFPDITAAIKITDMGIANPFMLVIPMFIVIVFLVLILRMTTEK